MSQSAAQRRDAARELARRMWVETGGTAVMSWDDLTAAIGSLDDTMDALPTLLNPLTTVKQNFLARLPEPFKSTATAQQKAIALTVWALKEAGII